MQAWIKEPGQPLKELTPDDKKECPSPKTLYVCEKKATLTYCLDHKVPEKDYPPSDTHCDVPGALSYCTDKRTLHYCE